MKGAWYVWVPTSVRVRPVIRALLERTVPDQASIDAFTAGLEECEMHSTVSDMIRIGLTRLSTTGDAASLSACAEMVAGMEYAQNDQGVGTLRHLSACCTPSVASFMCDECERMIRMKAWRHRDAWFMLRVSCMDAYALARVLGTDHDTVYYAGRAHTQRLTTFLRDRLAATTIAVPSQFRKLAAYASEHGVLHVECLKLDKRCVLMLGENHKSTHLHFAQHMIAFLNEACNAQEVDVLLEKHITNDKDPLQCDLMCNQPNVALHRIRCDAITTSPSCTKLTVVPVDNRHADLGFLRTEILDLWAHDPEFKAKAVEFQKNCIESLHQWAQRLNSQV